MRLIGPKSFTSTASAFLVMRHLNFSQRYLSHKLWNIFLRCYRLRRCGIPSQYILSSLIFIFIGKTILLTKTSYKNEAAKKRMYRKRKKLHKGNYVQEERESKNDGMESLEVNPQAQDQANKVPTMLIAGPLFASNPQKYDYYHY